MPTSGVSYRLIHTQTLQYSLVEERVQTRVFENYATSQR